MKILFDINEDTSITIFKFSEMYVLRNVCSQNSTFIIKPL